jgi:polyphosphate kinase
MITKRFIDFINEELKEKIRNYPFSFRKDDDIDKETLITLKNNLTDRLDEYKEGILLSITHDVSTNSVIYKKGFENIDVNIILRELRNEFGEDAIKELNVESFLRQIFQILELKKNKTKKLIRDTFVEYQIGLDERINDILNNKRQKEQHFEYEDEGEKSLLSRKEYESEKYQIQVELAKLQKWVMESGKRVAIVFEGRDAAGKGSTIKRFTEYLNPKGFRYVALGVPTPEEKKNWFPRYEKHLPKPGEIVFFDRSWYNRAVIEPAMGYCSEEEYMDFMDNVLNWEENLIKDGLILIKFWFSVTKENQEIRFNARKTSPVVYWKFSENDEKTLDKWDIISKYKNQMFNNTSNSKSPWVVINSNDKRIGRLNAMRYVLWEIDYKDKNDDIVEWYPEVVNVLK